MGIFSKKSDFSNYTKEELERMRGECVAKLNASVGGYRETDRIASIVKDSGAFGLRTMANSSSDRTFWQNRLNAIEGALKEKESPKSVIKEYKEAEAAELLKIKNNPLDDEAVSRLHEIRIYRLAWLCGLAGFSNDAKLSEDEIFILDKLISPIEDEMNVSAENYALLLGLIDEGSKNIKKVIPNYNRLIDDYSEREALLELSILEKLKKLESVTKRNNKGSRKLLPGSKAARRTERRKDEERLEGLINTKDFGVGGLE